MVSFWFRQPNLIFPIYLIAVFPIILLNFNHNRNKVQYIKFGPNKKIRIDKPFFMLYNRASDLERLL